MERVVATSLNEWFEIARPFEDFLAATVKNRQLWHELHARVRLPESLAEAEPRPDLRLLAIAEDWCGDAVNTLPVVARMAERLGMELRVLERDTWPELMDRYLTDGRSRSIPVVIVLDPAGRELGWWGPRPRPLQTWVLGEGQRLVPDDRRREQRRWYVLDRGRTTIAELTSIWSGTGAQP